MSNVIPGEGPKRYTRRDILFRKPKQAAVETGVKVAAATAVVALVGGGIKLGLDQFQNAADFAAFYLRTPPYNNFLDFKDKKYSISNVPVPVRIKEYVPHLDTITNIRRDKIIIRQGAPEESTDKRYVTDHEKFPSEIIAKYGARIGGARYNGNHGNDKLEHEGENYTFGEWFVTTDQRGNLVNPWTNQPLIKDEKPYFISASQINLDIQPSPPTAPVGK